MSTDSQGRLPRDAPWPAKEAAYEQMIRDLIAELEHAHGPIAEEDLDDELGDALRAFHGVPGYEYLAEVDAAREQEAQREDSERRAAASAAHDALMRGYSDDPPF